MGDVRSWCLRLNSDKITERRKACDQLKHLLKDEQVVAALDCKPSDSFNWDQVFIYAKTYFQKEARKLEDDERKKQNASQAVVTKTENQKRLAVTLLKLVLRQASLKVPRISARILIDLIFEVLGRRNPYLLENYAGDFLQLCVKYLFSFPQYYLAVHGEQWKDLLKICFWLYQQDLRHLGKTVVIDAVRKIVECCKMKGIEGHRFLPSSILRKLPNFLSVNMKETSVMTESALQFSLLHLLLSFTKAMAPEWRYVICRVGEDTLNPVLSMWENVASARQDMLMEYLNLQILVHHPQKDGAFNENSSYVNDSGIWRRGLHQIFQLIHDYLQQNSVKLKFISLSNPVEDINTIPHLLVLLASRLCHKLFVDTGEHGTLDITLNTQSTSISQGGRAAKRRRIEVGFQPLLSLLREEGTMHHCIPWYQILLELLKSYKLFFDEEKCSVLLELFTCILAECTEVVVQHHMIRCLEGLACRYNEAFSSNHAKDDLRSGKWTPIWDMTLRLVSGKLCSRPGLKLIKTLMDLDLVIPNVNVFKLFYEGHVSMTEEALAALKVLLQKVSLPNSFKSESAALFGGQVKDAHQTILQAILPNPTEGPVTALEAPTVLAQILLMLRHRDTKCAENHLGLASVRKLQNEGNIPENELKRLEEIFILCTFSCDIPKIGNHVDEQTREVVSSELKIVAEEEKKMIDHIFLFMKQILQIEDNDSMTVEALHVIVEALQLLLVLCLHISDQRLKELTKQALQLITVGVQKVSHSSELSRWISLYQLFSKLHNYYYQAHTWARCCKEKTMDGYGIQVVQMLVSYTPKPLLSLVVEWAKARKDHIVNLSRSGSSQGDSFRRESLSRGSSPDFEDLFESTSSVDATQFEEMEVEQDNEDTNSNLSRGNVRLGDINIYSHQDRCLVMGLHWMTLAYRSSLPEGEADPPLVDIIDMMLEISKLPDLELIDIALSLQLSHALFTGEYDGDNVEDGLNIISYIGKRYSQDPRVAAFIIECLKDLISVNGTSVTEMNQGNILKMCKGVIQVQLKNNYCQCIDEALFHFNAELVKLDPKREWSKYSVPELPECGELYKTLSSPSLELRIMAAKSIYLLFTPEEGSFLDSGHQDEIFRSVYQTVLEACTVHGSVPDDFQKDEGNTRIATYLLTLGIIAVTSPYLETKSLYGLCLAVVQSNIEPTVVSKVIRRIALSRNMSLKQYIRQHFPYLATQWIHDQKDFQMFPSCLLESATYESLLEENLDLLLPVLLEFNILQPIEALCTGGEKNVNDLLIEHFPVLMARILPYIAVETYSLENVIETGKIHSAKGRYKLLEKSLGKQNFNVLVTRYIGDIALNIVKLVHDPCIYKEGLVITPNPPHFPPIVIEHTLKFIGDLFEDKTLAGVLNSNGRELHKVIFGVSEFLAKASMPHDAGRALSAISAVVEVVLFKSNGELDDSALYTIQILVHTLTFYVGELCKKSYFLADYNNQILSKLCRYAIVNYPECLSTCLPVLISRLLPFTKMSSKIWQSTFEVVELVMSSTHQAIHNVIVNLSSLPDDEDYACLDSLRNYHDQLVSENLGYLALYEKVENFLCQTRDYADPHVLTNLCKEVKKNRNGISSIYNQSNANEESLGHQLTYRLVSLASSLDEKISIEASRCLGELGPIALGSPIFYIVDKNPFQIQFKENLDINVISQLIKILNRYLTTDSVDVAEAASSALYKILATQDGYKAARTLEESVLRALYPFMSRHRSKAGSPSESGIDCATYKFIVEDCGKWIGGSNFENWISSLTCLLIEAGCGSEILTYVLPVCRIKPEACLFVLPIAIHETLRTDKINRREVLSNQFTLFFHKHCTKIEGSVSQQNRTPSIYMDKNAIQVLLKVINYLRAQTPTTSFTNSQKCTPWDKNFWLKVNYLEVAQAAYYCGAYFSALLFLEIHCDVLISEAQEKDHKQINNRQVPKLQRVSFHKDFSTMQKLLLKVYSSLGDSDGVEGCGGGAKLLDPSVRGIRSKHRGQWIKTLEIHDAANSAVGVIDVLKDLRFFNTLKLVLGGSSLESSPELQGTYWESAWRLSQWDSANIAEKWDTACAAKLTHNMDFHQSLFLALQSIHHRDLSLSKQHTLRARLQIIENLKLSQVESSSTIYPLLSQLQILSEVETAANCLNSKNSENEFIRSVNELESTWTSRDEVSNVCYTYMEPIMTARSSILRALLSSHQKGVREVLHSTLLKKSMLARNCQILGSNCGCEAALVSAVKLDVPQCLKWKTQLEEAEVAKSQGDIYHAMRVLDILLEDMQKFEIRDDQEILFCQVIHSYGCVLMDSLAKPPRVVITEYFNRAVDILESRQESECRKVLENSYHKLSVYADKLYRDVRQYLESDTIQSKRENIIRSQQEIMKLINLMEKTKDVAEKKDLTRKQSILAKNVKVDQNVLDDLEKEREEFLFLALQNYLKCLLVSHNYDLHLYRTVALWTENLENTDINKLMNTYGIKIKSHKFVPLLYQLVARLTCVEDKKKQLFLKTLQNILERICLEHPHHSLPVVMALANAHADEEILKDSRSSSGRKKLQVQGIEEGRVQAAKLLVNKLKKTELGSHVAELERISLAYLALANWSDGIDKHNAGDKVKIPSNQPLMNIRNIQYTSALTRPLVLQPSGQYNPPVITSWENVCTFVGGVNAPKRMTVKTSDGLSQFELLKGRDDIRQDAVMQQVFGIVNELLSKNPGTSERALSMRTYRVVPLSQKSGLIQWCNNTQAFGEYLIGRDKKSGAHKLYYPNDYNAATCRQMMINARPESQEVRHHVFQDILDNFHAVFRNFFLENYPSPHEWYKRRLAYTRSVATNSMVGYILGLGDRHVENILLDKSTAELIHIDLGIAFDFGKILPTPETVPFRLTQDVLDGLGVLGVEGPLRQSCEATLRVLRSSAEVLVTVVEVLRHDPLYQWTLSPQQVARLQDEGENQEIGINSASMADRVVLRVQQKLAGFEDGFSRNVSEQVTVLIQQATSESNLSRLFPGWQPYL
ncbi:serine-protein kinase ATM isoform X2 [Palaemon carinicauda]|uniref:serine-protein kinase ATM isoform X2 n=1 Tax=Palaemon carinicauda TaxID=392227 RepID=UPI0035B5724C